MDTKYEFGLDEKGRLILIDEIHTPDSSRFWIKKPTRKGLKKDWSLKTLIRNSCVFGMPKGDIKEMENRRKWISNFGIK